MITHARPVLSLALLAATTFGCTSEIAGVRPSPDHGGMVQPSTSLLSYTHPRTMTDIPQAPLKSMGGSYAGTVWADTPDNIQLYQEMLAARITPETIHTMTNHIQRTILVSAGCGADPATSLSHDTWCDYVIDNRSNQPYKVSASTVHQYRHTVNGMLTRSSVSREREYRPTTLDTIARKDSVQEPTGPTGGTPTSGGGTGTTWTICWDFYELDLVTGEVRLLFTTCPVSPTGTPGVTQRSERNTAEGPARGTTLGTAQGTSQNTTQNTTQNTPQGERATRSGSDASRATQLVGVSALLVQVPALPKGAKMMVRRTTHAEHPYVILGAADASDTDWAGGIEIVKAAVRRDGADAPPALFALGRAAGDAGPEVRGRVAAMRARMRAANRREIPGFGAQRAVPMTVFVER